MLCSERVPQISNDEKDMSTSTIFLLVSVIINVVFFTGCFVLIWSKHYADSVIKSDEDQHYQELGPPREEISITYQNTVLH